MPIKLFGLYQHSRIPRLRENHRRFAERNGMAYDGLNIRTFYDKWALVYHLLEANPDETLVFIDAFSYFVSADFRVETGQPLLVQEINGQVMDNFFVVRSCHETKKLFHEVQRCAARRFAADGSYAFEVPLPAGSAKPYGFLTLDEKRFNLDLAFTDRGQYFNVANLPIGFDAKTEGSPTVDDILVVRYGGGDWASQLWTAAEILCHHRPETFAYAAEPAFEVVNPGHSRAIVTLSCPEPGIPPPDYAGVSEQNFRDYAESNGVTLYLYKSIPDAYRGLHSTWTKPYLLLRHLASHDYISWIDGDILVSKEFQLPEGEDVAVYNDPGAWLFNAGLMTFKNSTKTFAYLHAVVARCEGIADRSSLYINGSDQTQFIEEFREHFPDSLPRSNLVANIPVVFDSLRSEAPGAWHFMGLNPPSVRAVVMDYYREHILGPAQMQEEDLSVASGPADNASPRKPRRDGEITPCNQSGDYPSSCN